MSQVFISYKHSDGDFAEILVKRLKQAHFKVWIDEDDDKLPPGANWREEIDRAIKESFVLIVIITPQAKASEYVIYELGFAYGVGVQVLPIIRENTELHPRIQLLQHLDFTTQDSKQRPWGTLIKALRKVATIYEEQREQRSADLPASIKQAVSTLESPLPNVRSQAFKRLSQTSLPAAKDALRAALNSSLSEVRVEAALLLSDVSAAPVLVEALHDMDKVVSTRAMKALTRIGTPAIGFLLRALRDENVRVRRKAANALGDIRDDVAVPALLETLYDTDEQVRYHAALALGQIGASSVAGLLKALKAENEKIRADAAFALGLAGGLTAVHGLLEALHDDKQKDVRTQAAVALGQIGHTDALAGLRNALLHDEEIDVRCRAAISLGQIEHSDAVPGLLQALGDPSERVRQSVVVALEEIGHPDALFGLRKAFHIEKGDIKESIAHALENIELKGTDQM
jgi:HEAT repeat protein